MWMTKVKTWVISQFLIEWVITAFPNCEEILVSTRLSSSLIILLKRWGFEEFSFIKILYLPDTTTILLPMDWEMILNFRKLYTEHLFLVALKSWRTPTSLCSIFFWKDPFYYRQLPENYLSYMAEEPRKLCPEAISDWLQMIRIWNTYCGRNHISCKSIRLKVEDANVNELEGYEELTMEEFLLLLDHHHLEVKEVINIQGSVAVCKVVWNIIKVARTVRFCGKISPG